MNHTVEGNIHEVIEWEYHSTLIYDDPFNALELNVTITSPSQESWLVPAFWKGEHVWAVRFTAKEAGVYRTISQCTDTKNLSLHHVEKELTLHTSSKRSNTINLRISQNKRYIETKEGKPFFWLADTWWMGLSQRLSFPHDFTLLIKRRKTQGFNTILLVAGLFPDMDSFDERGKNEAGFPWEEAYARINPSYFDEADSRIISLIQEGFIPTILGSWGYYLHHMGEEKMKQHWRYIIARWGAYPIVWCIAGEATMPYYLSKKRTKDSYSLHKGWTDMAHYIQNLEAFGNLITIHPTEIGRDQIQDPTLLDFNLIQAGHSAYNSVSNSIKIISQEEKREPKMPLIVGEINYEGILNNTSSYIQRLSFWSAILSGAKGYSYGANGIWQVNTHNKPFGASPHGSSWGDVPWKESYLFEGATQLGYAKSLLEKYPWWHLEAHQERLIPQKNPLDYKNPKVAAIAKHLCIIYFPKSTYRWWNKPHYHLTNLEGKRVYEAFFWNPRTGEKDVIKIIKSNKSGRCKIPTLPSNEDWIFVLNLI